MRRRDPSARGALLLGLATLLAGCAPVYSRATTNPRLVLSPDPPESSAVEAGGLARILGRLIWPLEMDEASVLSSAYGHRDQPGGGERFHRGLDLRAREGAPVYAVAAGRVLESGTSGAYGYRIVLDHGEGLHSLYAHHRRNLATKGQMVRRGQVIGLVGHTGNATGDHLHFELRWRAGTVDPRTVLPKLRPVGIDR